MGDAAVRALTGRAGPLQPPYRVNRPTGGYLPLLDSILSAPIGASVRFRPDNDRSVPDAALSSMEKK